MITKHEAVARALVDLVDGAGITTVMREAELPEDCPPGGLANFVFEAPREIGRQLGTGVREISRICQIEVVVRAGNDADRRAQLEVILTGFGTLLVPSTAGPIGLSYLDLGEPSEPDVIPMEGSASLRGAVIPVELLYETSNNPMETEI